MNKSSKLTKKTKKSKLTQKKVQNWLTKKVKIDTQKKVKIDTQKKGFSTPDGMRLKLLVDKRVSRKPPG